MRILKKIFKQKLTYELIRDESGKHQIGGEKPSYFKYPQNEFISNFQYLGYLENSDEIFNWLPFRVHLICPIYLDIDKVYLDYQNPNAPTIISPLDTNRVTTAYDELDINSVIIFESVKVSLERKEVVDEYAAIGLAGKPEWTQSHEIPFCPKSNKPMKFLCQLKSFGDVKTTYTNVVTTPSYKEYFEKMNFWCDGDLYVFIEPTAKTMCYFIQNT